ncbi:hypothetical protein FHX11_003280 [Rhizobium sp. BK602]|nr:hypothetical protein [Rhizobium sp. BK602]
MKIHLLQRHGHQGQIFFVEFPGIGKLIDESRMNPVPFDDVGNGRGVIDMRENIRARIHSAKGFQNLLSSAHANQPIMYDCNAHGVLQKQK